MLHNSRGSHSRHYLCEFCPWNCAVPACVVVQEWLASGPVGNTIDLEAFSLLQ